MNIILIRYIVAMNRMYVLFGKNVAQELSLDGHLKLRRGDKSHRCFGCGGKFSLGTNLYDHIMRIRYKKGMNSLSATNQTCKKFTQKNSQNIGLNTHSG